MGLHYFAGSFLGMVVVVVAVDGEDGRNAHTHRTVYAGTAHTQDPVIKSWWRSGSMGQGLIQCSKYPTFRHGQAKVCAECQLWLTRGLVSSSSGNSEDERERRRTAQGNYRYVSAMDGAASRVGVCTVRKRRCRGRRLQVRLCASMRG